MEAYHRQALDHFNTLFFLHRSAHTMALEHPLHGLGVQVGRSAAAVPRHDQCFVCVLLLIAVNATVAASAFPKVPKGGSREGLGSPPELPKSEKRHFQEVAAAPVNHSSGGEPGISRPSRNATAENTAASPQGPLTLGPNSLQFLGTSQSYQQMRNTSRSLQAACRGLGDVSLPRVHHRGQARTQAAAAGCCCAGSPAPGPGHGRILARAG